MRERLRQQDGGRAIANAHIRHSGAARERFDQPRHSRQPCVHQELALDWPTEALLDVEELRVVVLPGNTIPAAEHLLEGRQEPTDRYHALERTDHQRRAVLVRHHHGCLRGEPERAGRGVVHHEPVCRLRGEPFLQVAARETRPRRERAGRGRASL